MTAWSDLGPGSFVGNKNTNLLDQSGDIKLDASIEYRSKLFWKFQGAIFVDAGNIWTIRDYDNQPGGVFKFDKFYKQIAVAYGLGLRLDLDFFILRFDGGMKALNPVYEKGKDRYPIIHPKFSRDFAFHFAVGYPFWPIIANKKGDETDSTVSSPFCFIVYAFNERQTSGCS